MHPALVQPRAVLLQDFGDYQDGYYSVQTTEGEQIAQLIAGYIDIILKKASAWVCGEPAYSWLLSLGCCEVPHGHAVLLGGLGTCHGAWGCPSLGSGAEAGRCTQADVFSLHLHRKRAKTTSDWRGMRSPPCWKTLCLRRSKCAVLHARGTAAAPGIPWASFTLGGSYTAVALVRGGGLSEVSVPGSSCCFSPPALQVDCAAAAV